MGRPGCPTGGLIPDRRQSTPTLIAIGLGGHWKRRRTIGGLAGATEPAVVEGLSGAFLMIDRDRWDEMGGFDTSFFMYAEELDLCYRLRQSGRDLIMTPKSEITHLVGGGSCTKCETSHLDHEGQDAFFAEASWKCLCVRCRCLFWVTAVNRTLAGWVMSQLTKKGRPGQLVRCQLADRLAAGSVVVRLQAARWPTQMISIIIPAYNEAGVIERTLTQVIAARCARGVADRCGLQRLY